VIYITQVKPLPARKSASHPASSPSRLADWGARDSTIRRAPDTRFLASAGQAPTGGSSPVSKGEQVYLALKQAIVSGEVLPGAAIDKAELCERFGVSRLPVTTALNRLAYDRLVLIEAQKGSYVTKIKLADVVQWMRSRRALEADLAGECARHLSGEVLNRIEQNLRYQQAAIGGNDHAGFFQLDVAFHQLLVDGLAMHRIGELLDSLRSHLDRVRRLLLPEPGRMESTLVEHEAIFTAIASRRRRQAEQAMRTHLDVVLERLIAFEKEHPDFFGR
jgi:GntR family transcriptional regulator, rspAB operon transcriptional repressor